MPSSGTYIGGGALLVLLGFIHWLRRQRNELNTSYLRDKVIVITGASSGLGEACAVAFYRAGAKVVLCARREDELHRVKNLMQATKFKDGITVHEPLVVKLDLEDFQSIPAKIEHILDIHGHIDVLVNNAGISFRGDVLNTSLDVFIKVMNINYLGQVAMTKACLQHMVARKAGHIVTISSIQGKISIPYRSAYSASKHAIQAFCDSLRAEVSEDNIDVTVISPGYIQTNLSVNAVTGSGRRYGVTDTSTSGGMPAPSVANQVVRVVCTRTKETLISESSHKLACYFRNIFPDVFFMLMKSRARKQRHEFLKHD